MKVALFMIWTIFDCIMDTLETTVEKLKSSASEKVEKSPLITSDSLSEAPKGRFDDLAGCMSEGRRPT